MLVLVMASSRSVHKVLECPVRQLGQRKPMLATSRREEPVVPSVVQSAIEIQLRPGSGGHRPPSQPVAAGRHRVRPEQEVVLHRDSGACGPSPHVVWPAAAPQRAQR